MKRIFATRSAFRVAVMLFSPILLSFTIYELSVLLPLPMGMSTLESSRSLLLSGSLT